MSRFVRPALLVAGLSLVAVGFLQAQAPDPEAKLKEMGLTLPTAAPPFL